MSMSVVTPIFDVMLVIWLSSLLFENVKAFLSLETSHLLFSSSRMILHQFSAWIGHHSTGHSSIVTSLWRPSDTLSMGSPPIHRCVTSQRVVFIVSLQLSLSQCLQDNLLSPENVRFKTLGLFVLALVLAPSFKRRLSMKWMANKVHWLDWWEMNDSVVDGSNHTLKQKFLRTTVSWKQRITDIQIWVLKIKPHLLFLASVLTLHNYPV